MPRKPLEVIPVIFRADVEDGRLWVTAVFPTLLGTDQPHTFTVYQHVGQHGTGVLSWYRRTRPATPAEYRPLLAELRGIYERPGPGDDPAYRLRVVPRMSRAHREIRKRDAAASRALAYSRGAR